MPVSHARAAAVISADGDAPGLLEILAQVPDPRKKRGIRFGLVLVLVLAVAVAARGGRRAGQAVRRDAARGEDHDRPAPHPGRHQRDHPGQGAARPGGPDGRRGHRGRRPRPARHRPIHLPGTGKPITCCQSKETSPRSRRPSSTRSTPRARQRRTTSASTTATAGSSSAPSGSPARTASPSRTPLRGCGSAATPPDFGHDLPLIDSAGR